MQLKNLEILDSAVAFLSFLIFLIHWKNNLKASLPNFLFRFFLLINCYYYLIAVIIGSDGILSVPYLFRTGGLAGLISSPIVFLILNKSLKGEAWNNRDFLHFVPALFYVIDFIPFFVLPNESKRIIINHLISKGLNAILGYNEGWILNGRFWITIKVLQPLIYSAISFFILNRTIQKSGKFFKKENSKLILLLYWLTGYLFINAIPVAYAFSTSSGSIGWNLTRIILTTSTLITCLYLLLNPEVLYGLKGIWVSLEKYDGSDNLENIDSRKQQIEIIDQPIQTSNWTSSESERNKVSNDYKKLYLNNIQVKKMEDTLSQYMLETMAYLQPGYSLPLFAKETGFPLQNLSAFLNQYKGENFNDYINRFRVNHLIEIYENDQSLVQKLTLESLGKQAGFGSRSTFINAFKKVTGKTPSTYFRD